MNDIQINNHSGVVKLVKSDNTPKESSTANQAVSASQSNADAQLVNQAAKTEQPQVKKVDANDQVDDRAKDQQALDEAVTRLNDFVQSTQRDLQFKLDEDSGKTVITVLDRQTQEVIRQIPDDEALKLAQTLHQDEPLTLFNAKV